MNFVVIRGEYPFDEVVDMITATSPEEALAAAQYKHKRDGDVFMRHPVVEPLEGGSSLFYSN